MAENLLAGWFELFIMVRSDKKSFKFGQLTMNFEIFKFHSSGLENFLNTENVEFDLLANIENKKDFAKFFLQFEAGIDDFITLSEYEENEDIIFTTQAKKMISTKIGIKDNIPMWINTEWSDHIELLQL